VWLSRVLRHTIAGPRDATPLQVDVGWFHAIAAAAAVRSGQSGVLSVPVVYGAVHLPTVGWFPLPASFAADHAEVQFSDHSASLVGLDVEMEPVRAHRTTSRGLTLDVIIDAVDPYRRFSAPEPAEPFGDVDFKEWTGLLDEAWAMLTESHLGYAEEVAAGVSMLVPLSADGGLVAASSSAAFGCVALSPKRSAAELAEALVHELQHSKLNALFDCVELYDPGNRAADLYAPWLDAPRPLAGLLHGIYAFVSVVEFWDRQRAHVHGSEYRSAIFTLAYRANQLSRVIKTVRDRPELTDLGREFVDGVAARLAACMPVEVPADIATVVGRLTDDHQAIWRLRHVQPRAETVTLFVDAWPGERPAGVDVRAGSVVRVNPNGAISRTALWKARALEPQEFQQLADHDPDVALVRGDQDKATVGYLRRLRNDSSDIAAWAGLGMALESGSLLRVPELVKAVHHELSVRTRSSPDPVNLIGWFDQKRALNE
jgi:HEXXH motif-containing protein